MPEFKILADIIDFMESNSVTAQTVSFSVDQELVDQLNSRHGTAYSVRDLEKAIDKCIAYEWIARRSLDRKYSSLCITTKGVGAARSRQKAEELKASRSWLKKTSDYIEDHKGLFVVMGFLVAVGTFAAKFFGVN